MRNDLWLCGLGSLDVSQGPSRTGHGSHSSLEARLRTSSAHCSLQRELPALVHVVISHEVRGEANPRKFKACQSPGEEPAPRHYFLTRLSCGTPVFHGYKDGAPRMGRHPKHPPFLSSWKSEPCIFLEVRRCLRLATCLSPGIKPNLSEDQRQAFC